MRLFRCARMSASISRETCAANRRDPRSDNRCLGCPGLGAAVEINLGDVMAIRECVGCGRTLTIRGQGLCQRCWDASHVAPVVTPEVVDAAEEDEWAGIDAGLRKKHQPAPVVSPLSRLLNPHGLTMDLPPTLAERMQAEGLMADDVFALLQMLLDGALCRRTEIGRAHV